MLRGNDPSVLHFLNPGEWIGKMGPSFVRDSAVVQFMNAVVRLDPSAAAVWATEIHKGLKRKIALGKVWGSWKEVDQAAAEAWFLKNGITPPAD